MSAPNAAAASRIAELRKEITRAKGKSKRADATIYRLKGVIRHEDEMVRIYRQEILALGGRVVRRR